MKKPKYVHTGVNFNPSILFKIEHHVYDSVWTQNGQMPALPTWQWQTGQPVGRYPSEMQSRLCSLPFSPFSLYKRPLPIGVQALYSVSLEVLTFDWIGRMGTLLKTKCVALFCLVLLSINICHGMTTTLEPPQGNRYVVNPRMVSVCFESYWQLYTLSSWREFNCPSWWS